MNKEQTYSGLVIILGKPNVGKSTLFNQLLGRKLSITSRKPQTTRSSIIGIQTEESYQTIYIDTPGLQIKNKNIINNLINQTINQVIDYIRILIFVVTSVSWTLEDKTILNELRNYNYPVILVINKIDNLVNKEQLLPYIKFLSQQMTFHTIIPICAKNSINITDISIAIRKLLPLSTHFFPANYITSHTTDFIISEIIREKIIRLSGDELPYLVSVKIERFFGNINRGYCILGLILVNRNSQKKIIIGSNKNRKIKIIGITARKDIENFLRSHVYLDLQVKVNSITNN